ncbi:ParB/RepB/Spo0J family partition protein [Dyadobacter sp. LHD-138]|uniref:ParB/RepB/Spo0J family partition protein n=1 Tax=Dyadobacter sp. LHD-138 TaxID=3071413 RepID=UPI0027E1CE4D|nr:ParB/RepB/Spo0J family partition protein [Dyadobacter sp. LHD-138]MDQ6482242.1 ParB/RepB/Spo0J family partition protein [Dyadobacter sp. LHD-138]
MKQNIKISLLDNNEGQIEGLPANPRLIKDDKFEKLKLSLTDDPEMLDLRELLVVPHGKRFVVIAGNMRLRAAIDLEFIDLPCKIIPSDTDPKKLRAIAQKDNISYGEHDWDMLMNEWDTEELKEWGIDIRDVVDDDDEKEEEPKVLSKKLLVECSEANDLDSLYEELQKRGFLCTLK